MSDVTIHKNMLLRKVCVEENCRLRQKYSICLLEEVVMLGCFASKAQVCRTIFCESVSFLYALQHDYGSLQSTYSMYYPNTTNAINKCRILLKVFAFKNIIVM